MNTCSIPDLHSCKDNEDISDNIESEMYFIMKNFNMNTAIHLPGDRMAFNHGDTGFMVVATSLAMLMTHCLAFFYRELVGRKNVLRVNASKGYHSLALQSIGGEINV